MGKSRAFRFAVLALATLGVGTAYAGSPSLVVELESGRVLHADRATDPWYPASITKLMTVYVALDLVEAGQARMDQLLTVSEAAAALPPSKMAFKPGTQIRLDNALKIIMVKSANDVAATIAENLGGSIDGFATMMNEEARRLGMRESRFVNPHGLPDDRNQTSARDMAILGRALLTHFPEYQGLFEIGAIQYGRRIMRNTNGLIGRYPGADGMKTGFICSAGFNVVASATRNGRHLITVVLGAPSANERTMKAAELFDLGFNSPTSPSSYSLDTLPASVSQTPPDMRPLICDRKGPMPQEENLTTVGAEPESTTPNLLSSPNVFAYAGAQPQRTALGPRSAVEPVPVWIGLNPPSPAELAAQAAAEDAADKARTTKSKKTVAAKSADQSRASISIKPVSSTVKPAAKTPPKAPAKTSAKASPKPATKAN
ncbi:D-alanyl-D-alanine carboxypeptidase family protein [Microvirga flavescens]|uniref:D-alanyl-D-alanine carboxypeptidase family protein n=1 Tax=Microvirga flavescens TaxID=2249811 RepID=UPI0013005286|nr:D-alanyl-D-alanine carboxypeptidase family protein [Microvirga flavescens]